MRWYLVREKGVQVVVGRCDGVLQLQVEVPELRKNPAANAPPPR
jgi:hypothetical protein